MAKPKIDVKVDCRGMNCPMPVLLAAEKIADLKKGQVAEVTGTDRGMKLDFPAWCEATGNKLLEVREDGKFIVVLIKKA